MIIFPSEESCTFFLNQSKEVIVNLDYAVIPQKIKHTNSVYYYLYYETLIQTSWQDLNISYLIKKNTILFTALDIFNCVIAFL